MLPTSTLARKFSTTDISNSHAICLPDGTCCCTGFRTPEPRPGVGSLGRRLGFWTQLGIVESPYPDEQRKEKHLGNELA